MAVSQNSKFKLVLIGKTGSGVSSTGNTILNNPGFSSVKSLKSITTEVKNRTVIRNGAELDVYETPGLFHTRLSNNDVLQKWREALQRDPSVKTVFLVIIKPDRFTSEEKQTLKMIEEFLEEGRLQNSWIVFTRGEENDENNIKGYISEIEEVKRVVEKFQNRYVIFNNKSNNPEEASALIQKIQTTMDYNEWISLDEVRISEKRRIMLLGKSGVGKSSSGNTILGKDVFHAQYSVNSVTTRCKYKRSEHKGQRIGLLDTPGFFDTNMEKKDLAKELGRSLYKTRGGVHAFLLVYELNRFTKQEVKIFKMTKKIFGKNVTNHMILLFTHGEEIVNKTIIDEMKQNIHLKNVSEQCGGRFHILNNKAPSYRKQVTELLQKIDTMLGMNGGKCYTNEMYEAARYYTWEAFWEKLCKFFEDAAEQLRKTFGQINDYELQENLNPPSDSDTSDDEELSSGNKKIN